MSDRASTLRQATAQGGPPHEGDHPAGPAALGLRTRYPIRTARLDLRGHRPDDLDDLVEFHSRPDVVRYLPWPVRNREQTRIVLEAKTRQSVIAEPGDWLVLAIELRETGRVVGEVLLKWTSREHRQGELGVVLDPRHQGCGLAAEAASAVLDLGFGEFGLHRIAAFCVGGNHSSMALLQRLGMRREGHLLESALLDGAWVDQIVFGLREHEWRDGPPVTADR